MNNKKNIQIGIFALTIILIIVSFASLNKKYQPSISNNQTTELADGTSESTKKEVLENNEPPVFAWIFKEDDSLNLDGLPQTNIFLEAKYANGIVQNKLIDTTPGSCNSLTDSNEDIAPNSSVIQCYSAGLGYRYKIIKGDNLYQVLRKTFEEALPDYTPPSYEYEVVSEFSL